MRQQAIDLLVDAWWSAFYGIGRCVPVVPTTRKRQAEAERNAYDLGRDAEHFWPRPPEPRTPERNLRRRPTKSKRGATRQPKDLAAVLNHLIAQTTAPSA